jgi:phospholipid/cholesterol/gamma-HCH transport system ATP-binding protein
MTEKEAHIIVQDLTMAYGDFVLMRDLNFAINRSDIFIIMGGSGCGKSTLMTMLIGLKTPAKGKIFYGEVDFWGPIKLPAIGSSAGPG